MVPETLRQADIPAAVRQVLATLTQSGHRAYLVGGCVRDLLRGMHPKDFDVATSALPTQVQKCFRRVIPTGIQHGTVTVVSGGLHVEVTTFRSEGEYVDGRRPSTVAFHTDIEVDLSRRDFTINAMAYDPVQDELVDPFGGQADLSARLIRCVGTPAERFGEDGLRALRAARFAAVLGVSLDGPTEDAIEPALAVFRKVAPERVREELTKLLLSERPHQGTWLLHRTGLLGAILPEVMATGAQLPRGIDALAKTPPLLEVRLAVLTHGLAAEVARAALQRLRCSNKTVDLVGHLLAFRDVATLASASDGEVRRFLARLGPEHLDAVFAVATALAVADLGAVWKRCTALLTDQPALYPKQLALNGGDLMRLLGVGPSPLVGEATRYLMEQVLDDPRANSVEQLTRLLQAWAKSRPS